jgi:hypothetical protein
MMKKNNFIVQIVTLKLVWELLTVMVNKRIFFYLGCVFMSPAGSANHTRRAGFHLMFITFYEKINPNSGFPATRLFYYENKNHILPNKFLNDN